MVYGSWANCFHWLLSCVEQENEKHYLCPRPRTNTPVTGIWFYAPTPHGLSLEPWSDLRKFCDLAEKAGKWFGVSKCCLYIYFSILVAFLRKATLSHTWNTAVGTAQQLSVLQLCFKCYDTSWGKRFEKEMLFVYVKIESRRPKCFAVSALRSSVKRWYPIAVCLFQPGTETICLK